MSEPDDFVRHCLDLLSVLGPCQARPMFGGWGIKLGEIPLGLIAQSRLYLAVDDETVLPWRVAGCAPFRYQAKEGRVIEISQYREPPDDAMESAEDMAPWARMALEAGQRVVEAQAAELASQRPRSRARRNSGSQGS